MAYYGLRRGVLRLGRSGLLGILVMGAEPVGTKGMLLYCVGLAISCVMGFVLTFFTVPAERVKDV